MKYVRICFVLLLAIFLFAGCEKNASDSDEITVVTTVFPQYDFTRQIIHGTDTKVEMLIPPGTEPHSYDPTPDDMIAAAECDLFITVGGESEAWAKRIIAASELSDGKILALMDIVPLLTTESGHGDGERSHEHTHMDEKHDHVHDEHIWTSPKNAMTAVGEICERLCRIDPENSEIYRENTERYLDELTALDLEFTRLAEDFCGVMVFGDRFPFLYLARAYGLEYTSPFRGCSAHTEASLSEIADAVSSAREHGARVIFSVDFSNGKLARTIASEAGAEVVRLYSCHTVSADDFESGVTYVELMKKNIISIGKAVQN